MSRDGLEEGLSKEVPLVQKPAGETGASHPSARERLDQAGDAVQGPWAALLVLRTGERPVCAPVREGEAGRKPVGVGARGQIIQAV